MGKTAFNGNGHTGAIQQQQSQKPPPTTPLTQQQQKQKRGLPDDTQASQRVTTVSDPLGAFLCR
jgi:hypothetical protein